MEPFVSLGPVHPHFLFEALAYAIGFALYRRARARGDELDSPTRWSVVVAAAVGGALGSKLLALVNDPATLAERMTDPIAFLAGGKTMVGGLIGGWIAVEVTKRALGIETRTGDLFALPLCVGIAIGRIGCFLTGLPDRTCGIETSLPIGVDFGDGIARHPTQLYEIAFLVALALHLVIRARRPFARGALFREVLVAYVGFRLACDFLKPGTFLFGLTAIQWACALTLLYHLLRRPKP